MTVGSTGEWSNVRKDAGSCEVHDAYIIYMAGLHLSLSSLFHSTSSPLGCFDSSNSIRQICVREGRPLRSRRWSRKFSISLISWSIFEQAVKDSGSAVRGMAGDEVHKRVLCCRRAGYTFSHLYFSYFGTYTNFVVDWKMFFRNLVRSERKSSP